MADKAKKILGGKKKKPDTVRKKKGNPKAATQRFLPIAEIRNDTVILKSGGLRAVLTVEALNFNLKSETEQQGIISGYQSFINTLSFPLQICIKSRKVNIDPYISNMKELAEKQENQLLKDQTIAYTNFIEKIIDVADIMAKTFYVVIPLDDTQTKKSSFASIFKFLGIDDTEAKAVQRYKSFLEKHEKLKDRINLVESGLNNVGLTTHRLETSKLIELYYQCFNPRTSQEQKIGDDLNTASLVM